MNDCSQSLQPISVTLAIIHQDGKYLMQLRDNIPTIVHPGVWGLFGGHLEPGEKPEAGLKRELIEEINYQPQQLKELGCYTEQNIKRYLFFCPLIVTIDELELNEGWDLGLLTPTEIKLGYAYSAKAGESRPIGGIHRQILLNFMASDLADD
ncbi:NUDIX domain-containing protein [Pleurocapsa sp. PCC 7319]|uniref:NUDIX hydrolase n=1 Tax=Pleurocapsa sp. PCC 7319 TaxID=118161 RepID=UPI00034C7980|nr:NUDIX domain-containing protein [Pleurocapsa sp. PCC 7319]